MTTEMKIFQNPVIRLHSRRINRHPSHSDAVKEFPALGAHCAVSLKGSEGWKPEYFPFYDYVAKIEATDLEDAFSASNIGPCEFPYQRHHQYRPMHSLSVGDIIYHSGLYYMVDPIGFARVNI